LKTLCTKPNPNDRKPQACCHSGHGCCRVTRLTLADENRTLTQLRALRSDVLDPTISVHRGRMVKRTGDGASVEFRNVVDAVRCAVEIQGAMLNRNAGVPPETRIELRIRIHLGDVVNVTARLEGIAMPGAVYLPEDSYWQVAQDLDVRYVLEGSARASRNRIRITAQLIEAGNGRHLWVDRFDGSLGDVFDLQDQIVTKIVDAVEPTLRQAEIERSQKKPVEAMTAHELYLRAQPHAVLLRAD